MPCYLTSGPQLQQCFLHKKHEYVSPTFTTEHWIYQFDQISGDIAIEIWSI